MIMTGGSESKRLRCHELLLENFANQKNLLFLNENRTLEFLSARASTQFDKNSDTVIYKGPVPLGLDISYRYRGKTCIVTKESA